MKKNAKNAVTHEEKLAKSFLSLNDLDECRAFFADLFTTKEIEELSMRLEVARLLKEGANYIDIASRTGASTATISRVSKCLSGKGGGYRMVLSRLDADPLESDENVIYLDTLPQEEASAVKTIVKSMRFKDLQD